MSKRDRKAWGPFFKGVRAVAKTFLFSRGAPGRQAFIKPCVLVCRHKDMTGPIRTMLWLPGPIRPWVLDVFFEKESCYRQFRDYTLTERLRWPKALALGMARLLSGLMPALLASMRAIPVHRGGARVTSTFRATLDALLKGEIVILYPDVRYTDTSAVVGEIYEGFLLLGEIYRRKTGKDLPFYPLAVRGRRIVMGEAFYTEPGEPIGQAGARMRAALQALEPDA